MGSLQHRLGKERYEPVAPAFGSCLDLDAVRHAFALGDEVAATVSVVMSADLPIRLVEERDESCLGGASPVGSVRFGRERRLFHCIYRGQGNYLGHDNPPTRPLQEVEF